MWCVRYRRLLIPYVECELGERARARLEAHVSRCPKCARELALIRSVSGELRSAESPAMEPAPDLWARVSARIERESLVPAPKTWARVTQAVSACAAAVLVAAVGINLMHTNPPTVSPTTPSAPMLAEAPVNKPAPPPTKHVERSRPKVAPPVRHPLNNAPVRRLSPTPSWRNVAALPGGPHVVAPRRAAVHFSLDGTAGLPRKHTITDYAYLGDSFASAGEKKGDMSDSIAYVPASPARAFDSLALSSGPAAAKPAETVGMAGIVAAAPASAPAALNAVRGGAHYFDDKAEGVAERNESVVDELNKTEGVRFAALFSYP